MKLRIKGNSIRLRLGRSEVMRLKTAGAVEESTAFGPSDAQRFIYALYASGDASGVSASFVERRLVVRVPSDVIDRWVSTDQVGIRAVQPAGDEGGLQVLIEKDFECVQAPADESQDDAFPNPQLGSCVATPGD